jgi:hypothetical protein
LDIGERSNAAYHEVVTEMSCLLCWGEVAVKSRTIFYVYVTWNYFSIAASAGGRR